MSYKILFSDLDGTLLSLKNDVSDFTAGELKRIKDQVPIVLVSARMPKSMVYLQERLGIEQEPMICYNGALILKENRVISSITIEMPVIEAVFQCSRENKVKLGLYFEDEWYVEEMTERVRKEIFNTRAEPDFMAMEEVIKEWKTKGKSAHKIMCMGTEENIDRIFPVLTKEFGHSLHIYRSNATLIEIADKRVSKLSGIKTVLEEFYPFSLENAVAFGDNYNDMEMIKAVGCGVAVDNAREELKEIADVVTDHFKEDGVAKYVKQLF